MFGQSVPGETRIQDLSSRDALFYATVFHFHYHHTSTVFFFSSFSSVQDTHARTRVQTIGPPFFRWRLQPAPPREKTAGLSDGSTINNSPVRTALRRSRGRRRLRGLSSSPPTPGGRRCEIWPPQPPPVAWSSSSSSRVGKRAPQSRGIKEKGKIK